MDDSDRPDSVPSAARAVLEAFSLTAELEPEALELLAARAVRREVDPDQVVFLEGEPSEGLYLVERGWLKGSKVAASGREQVLRYFGPGDAVQEVGLFLETPNPATLIALEPATVWVVPHEAVRALVDARPQLLWPLTRALARRLLYLVGLVEDLSLLPLEARVARYLLEHADGDAFERPRWATQEELAARLGTVPDVLQRVLRGLADEGLIAVGRRRIELRDRAGLEAKSRRD